MPPLGPKTPEIKNPPEISEERLMKEEILADVHHRLKDAVRTALPETRRGIFVAVRQETPYAIYRVDEQPEYRQMRAKLSEWSGKHRYVVLQVDEIELIGNKWTPVDGSKQTHALLPFFKNYSGPLDDRIEFAQTMLDTVNLIVDAARVNQATVA